MMKAAGEPMYPSGGWAGRAGAVGYCRAGDKSWAGKWEQGREGQGTSSSETPRGCPEELAQGRALGNVSRHWPCQEKAVPGYSQPQLQWGQKHFRESNVLIFPLPLGVLSCCFQLWRASDR